jgi:flagellin
VADFRVNSAKFNGASLDINMQVTTSAQQAGMFLSMGGTSLDLGASDEVFRIEVTGSKGARELEFTSGQTLAAMAAAINTFTDVTGVQATVSSTGIVLASTDFGSNEFVTVKIVDDGGMATGSSGIYSLETDDFARADSGANTEFNAAANGVTDKGQNLGATINGIRATSNGKTARVNTDFLDVEISLTTGEAQALGNVGSGSNPAFKVTGGGASFQLAGRVDINGRVALGIQDVAARKLGSSTLGFLDSLGNGKDNNVIDGNLTDGQKIVTEALKQVTGLRGRLGAFQKNTIGATIRSLGISVENTAAAQSVIRDADFASETAALTRSQILVSASTNILSLANQQPNAALQLLG